MTTIEDLDLLAIDHGYSLLHDKIQTYKKNSRFDRFEKKEILIKATKNQAKILRIQAQSLGAKVTTKVFRYGDRLPNDYDYPRYITIKVNA